MRIFLLLVTNIPLFFLNYWMKCFIFITFDYLFFKNVFCFALNSALSDFIYFLYKFIYFNWRLITLHYCIDFAIHQHESAAGRRGVQDGDTCYFFNTLNLYLSFGLLRPLHYVLFILYFLATVPITPSITTLSFLPILSHLNLYKSTELIYQVLQTILMSFWLNRTYIEYENIDSSSSYLKTKRVYN